MNAANPASSMLIVGIGTAYRDDAAYAPQSIIVNSIKSIVRNEKSISIFTDTA